MQIAYEIPFYRARFEQSGTKPEDYTCGDDLKKFPVLTKEELRDWADQELNENPEKYQDWHVSPTSGSTGIPLRTPFSPKENAWIKANFMRSIMMAGFIPGVHKCLPPAQQPPYGHRRQEEPASADCGQPVEGYVRRHQGAGAQPGAAPGDQRVQAGLSLHA